MPEAVTVGWTDRNERHGSRVLGGYLGILNAGTRYGDGDSSEFYEANSLSFYILTINRRHVGRQRSPDTFGICPLSISVSSNMNLQSKLTVLRSLASFLRICISSLEGTKTAHDSNLGNEPLNAWFLGNVFSSPEAFEGYDKLFTPEHQSTGRRSTHRRRLERADADDEEGDQFVNSFPLLQEKIGEPWTLNDLSLLDLSGPSGSEHYLSQSSSPEFVAVSSCSTFFSLRGAQDVINSTYVVHYIQLSLRPTWTVHLLSFRLLQAPQKRNFNSC